MLKTYDLKTTRANHESVPFFYRREKNDINGNPRFRVYFIDSETSTVYETILRCYEFEIAARITRIIEEE
jgi:hypothetical protein